MTKTIVLFKNDLRLSDNKALDYARQNNHKILFLYVFDQSLNIGSASKWFLHKALESLQSDLKTRYSANLIIKSGDTKNILENLVRKYQINCLLWNRVYEPESIENDTKIKEYFRKSNLEVESFNSSLLFEPSKIKNLSGEYFKVFTPFWKKCQTQLNLLESPYKIPKKLDLIDLSNDEESSLNAINLLPKNPNWAKNWDNLYKISEIDAHNLTEKFMENKLANYKEGRDFPASNNTSLLSPYLHFGLISPKQIYFKSLPFLRSQGSEHFLSELGWREFSYHLLYNFPKLPYKNFKEKFNNFPWKNDQEKLKKWQKGQTGFPIIDAGMRQLWQTGWMHNRVRMIVASFLTKNLLIDWKLGQEWFWDCLLDADLAVNSASWQWVAGSGADAAPYFRIFNPITQSQKFDKEGKYIRKWIPEISHLSNEEIHCPIDRSSYPKEMIDLKFSRNLALEIYKKL